MSRVKFVSMVMLAGAILCMSASAQTTLPAPPPPAPVSATFALKCIAVYDQGGFLPPPPTGTTSPTFTGAQPTIEFVLAGTGSADATDLSKVVLTINPLNSVSATATGPSKATAVVTIDNPLTRSGPLDQVFAGTGTAAISLPNGTTVTLAVNVQGLVLGRGPQAAIEGVIYNPAPASPTASPLPGPFKRFLCNFRGMSPPRPIKAPVHP